MVLIDSQIDTCRRVLVVGVDPGIDDAFALLVLIAAHKINLICLAGIVCSTGNVNRDQSCENLATITSMLNMDNNTLPITYFEGSSTSMIKQEDYTFYYGNDGLGDVPNRPIGDTSQFKNYLDFHYFMNELTKDYPNKVSFMSLGPLTVAATIFLIQPELNLKDIWIMGGNDIDKEDFTEWNFYFDPHAANVTLNSSNVPVYITTFQACENVGVPMTWRNESLGAVNTTFINFMNKAEANFYGESVPDTWEMYDAVVAAIFVNNAVILEKEVRGVEVYLGTEKEQGLLIAGAKNVTFIQTVDVELYEKTVKGAAELFV